jgi:hypothetical protein
MIDTIKRRIITALTIITLIAISSDSCNPTTAETENLKPVVASITVGYEDGTTIELTPDSADFDDVCDEALPIALSINSQCRCVVYLQTVEQLSETQQRFVYIFFSQPIEITTCILIDDEGQEYITTNEDDYRIISTTVMVIFLQESLPEIWASCSEAEDLGTICGCWGSAMSMDKLNSLINDFR